MGVKSHKHAARRHITHRMPTHTPEQRFAIKNMTRPENFVFPPGELERYERGADIGIMMHVQRCKFLSFPNLKAMLLATGMRRIVESAPWDEHWGTGRSGSGRNALGACLMALRAELRGVPPSQ